MTEQDEAVRQLIEALATSPPAAPPLDVERLARAFVAVGFELDGLTPQEGRAAVEQLAAEYARLSPEQEDDEWQLHSVEEVVGQDQAMTDPTPSPEPLDDLWAAYDKATAEDNDMWRAEFRHRIEAEAATDGQKALLAFLSGPDVTVPGVEYRRAAQTLQDYLREAVPSLTDLERVMLEAIRYRVDRTDAGMTDTLAVEDRAWLLSRLIRLSPEPEDA